VLISESNNGIGKKVNMEDIKKPIIIKLVDLLCLNNKLLNNEIERKIPNGTKQKILNKYKILKDFIAIITEVYDEKIKRI